MNKIMNPELDLINLINQTQTFTLSNQQEYSHTAMSIIDCLYRLLFNKHLSIIGINHRLKSPESLKEKILRKKLYKNSKSPEQVLEKMTDLIGIMIECEFMSDEKKIFSCIHEAFDTSADGVFLTNNNFPNIYVNLGVPQPVRQKNGNELYKLDCYYSDGEKRVNFELQIKSLVNSFWCEVEHNIVYKNNYYISSDDYVSEMLSAVRLNLAGLDRILELINGRITALTAYNVVKDLRLNAELTNQLVSDLINAKMIESVGFTVEAKRIRDLLSWYILQKSGTDDENSSAFTELSDRFRQLHQRDIRFDTKIEFCGKFHADDLFSQGVGGRLISLMNSDFEWHAFFTILFALEEHKSNEESFLEFVETLKDLYCSGSHFNSLYERLPQEDAEAVCDEVRLFLAEALCRLGDYGILPIAEYKSGLEEVRGFLQYTMNCLESFPEWIKKRSAVEAVIEKSLRKIL